MDLCFVTALKVKRNVLPSNISVWLLEQSDEVRISLCRLRNTELTANNAVCFDNSTGNACLL